VELDNCSEDLENSEQQNMSAAQNVPGFIQSIGRSTKKVDKAIMTVDIMETRMNEEIKKKYHRMRPCIFTKFIMYFDQEFHLQKYHGRILSSCMKKLVHKPSYSGQYTSFGEIYTF
jgi:hypothetical protein